MKTICVLLVLALSACANLQLEGYNNWVQNARVQAERGEIKWSEYYQGCFSRLVEVPRGDNGKLLKLEHYNALIGYSLEYEGGRISKLEFENKRRSLQLEYVRYKEDSRRNRYHAETAGDIYPH